MIAQRNQFSHKMNAVWSQKRWKNQLSPDFSTRSRSVQLASKTQISVALVAWKAIIISETIKTVQTIWRIGADSAAGCCYSLMQSVLQTPQILNYTTEAQASGREALKPKCMDAVHASSSKWQRQTALMRFCFKTVDEYCSYRPADAPTVYSRSVWKYILKMAEKMTA